MAAAGDATRHPRAGQQVAAGAGGGAGRGGSLESSSSPSRQEGLFLVGPRSAAAAQVGFIARGCTLAARGAPHAPARPPSQRCLRTRRCRRRPRSVPAAPPPRRYRLPPAVAPKPGEGAKPGRLPGASGAAGGSGAGEEKRGRANRDAAPPARPAGRPGLGRRPVSGECRAGAREPSGEGARPAPRRGRGRGGVAPLAPRERSRMRGVRALQRFRDVAICLGLAGSLFRDTGCLKSRGYLAKSGRCRL